MTTSRIKFQNTCGASTKMGMWRGLTDLRDAQVSLSCIELLWPLSVVKKLITLTEINLTTGVPISELPAQARTDAIGQKATEQHPFTRASLSSKRVDGRRKFERLGVLAPISDCSIPRTRLRTRTTRPRSRCTENSQRSIQWGINEQIPNGLPRVLAEGQYDHPYCSRPLANE